MYHKRRLGVKEGNAIEDIVAFEMRQKRGEATTADYLAFNKACQHLGIRRTDNNIVHPAFRGEAPPPKRDDVPPMVIDMFSPVWPAHMYGPGALLVGWVAAWIGGCVLLIGAVWLAHECVGSFLQSLASFAHP